MALQQERVQPLGIDQLVPGGRGFQAEGIGMLQQNACGCVVKFHTIASRGRPLFLLLGPVEAYRNIVPRSKGLIAFPLTVAVSGNLQRGWV